MGADKAPWCPECGPTCPLHNADSDAGRSGYDETWRDERIAYVDLLAVAHRILAPGDDDNVTLGEIRREYGIDTRPTTPGLGSSDE